MRVSEAAGLAMVVVDRARKLGNVRAQCGADALEGTVEAGGQRLHARGSTEGNQSNDQSVFHQILTFFAAGQILDLHVELDQQCIHSGLSRGEWLG